MYLIKFDYDTSRQDYFYLSFFDKYELVGDISKTIFSNKICGNLLIELLNNYTDITKILEDTLAYIIEGQEKNRIIEMLPYTISHVNNDFEFIYEIIKSEFKNMSCDFLDTRSNSENTLVNLNESLKHIHNKNQVDENLEKYAKEIEKKLHEHSFEKCIEMQIEYIKSILKDLDELYKFAINFNYTLKRKLLFKAF